MSTDRTNFENWWARPIEDLAPDEHNGFAVLALSFPILERYLREKSGVSEGTLHRPFYDELHAVFPELDNSGRAKEFWHAYRNGLLHQSTFSKRTQNGTAVPAAWITPGQVEVVEFDSSAPCFRVNAAAFAERVLATVRGDFDKFAGSSSPDHPLPTVEPSTHTGNPGAQSGVR